MCISIAQTPSHSQSQPPLIIPLPAAYTECFPPSQASTRGTTTWNTLFSTPNLAAGIASLPPDRSGTLSLHRHAQPELYHVLSGCMIVEIEGVRHRVEKGMTLFVPGDAEHGVMADASEKGEVCRWLYVFPGKFEDVVYRFRSEGAYGDGVKAKL